ncbi:hypothetical protein GSI_08858 [Ganoderma sinense ZZ0214-1]|uniref:Uncharacterized protein n=1 Tax=Ganoderma sinense ZZ0214-1 TaxID=1077348 RepID=A0A2G8S4V8_9APHY|nr:hypothetical protein GSI_08858 [Ganoderma sinense ZZ0214-1]
MFQMDTPEDHQPSTSVSTIRGFRALEMSMAASESAPAHDEHQDSHSPLRPSTPHSGYQSEPGSPSGDSISSFPSVGSSFLFSSGPTSPPHPAHHLEVEDADELGDSTSGLVIPSLTLPSPSRHPTVYGQTLGDVRLLLLGPRGADMSAVASQLVDDNEDVVEVGLWDEDRPVGVSTRGRRKSVLHVSTNWVEHRDRHGLERVEPARNVEIVELPPYDNYSEAQSIVERIIPIIHYPFREVLDILNHEHPPSGTLAHLLSSSCSPLYTALIMLATPSALSPIEKTLVESLSTHIPIIVLPPSTPFTLPSSHDHARRASSSHLSAFRPASLAALRAGLFRNPTTLATLRAEASSRFLRWREVERAVERVRWSAETSRPSVSSSVSHHRGSAFDINNSSSPSGAERHSNAKAEWFDKQAWEAQWDPQDSLSREVALHLRRRSEPPRRVARSGGGRRHSPLCCSAATADPLGEKSSLVTPPCGPGFDPLHLPSLVVFSFSLLGALRTRVARALGWKSGQDEGRRRPSIARRTSKEAPREEVASVRSGSGTGIKYTFGLGIALVSAFCAGVGIGLIAVTRF